MILFSSSVFAQAPTISTWIIGPKIGYTFSSEEGWTLGLAVTYNPEGLTNALRSGNDASTYGLSAEVSYNQHSTITFKLDLTAYVELSTLGDALGWGGGLVVSLDKSHIYPGLNIDLFGGGKIDPFGEFGVYFTGPQEAYGTLGLLGRFPFGNPRPDPSFNYF
jgi:hypothetical protein